MILLNVNESISTSKTVLKTHYNVDEIQWHGKCTLTNQYDAYGAFD